MGNDIALATDYATAAFELWNESIEDLTELAGHAKSPNTLAGYRSDWRQFSMWARSRGVEVAEVFDGAEVPPALVMLYVSDCQGVRKPATVSRHLAAIRHFHHDAGLASPTDHPEVRRLVAGFGRKWAHTPDRAEPLFLGDLRAGLPKGGELRAVRDRAILLVGWWAALRRSELVAITVADLSDHPEGLVVRISRSKTDQGGAGQLVAVHYREDETVCPVRAVRAWLGVSRIELGRVFPISARTVSRVTKGAAARAGFSPVGYSAHSLRAGFVSECDRRGIPSGAVRSVTRHTSDQMLSVYSRPGELFTGSAGAWFEE